MKYVWVVIVLLAFSARAAAGFCGEARKLCDQRKYSEALAALKQAARSAPMEARLGRAFVAAELIQYAPGADERRALYKRATEDVRQVLGNAADTAARAEAELLAVVAENELLVATAGALGKNPKFVKAVFADYEEKRTAIAARALAVVHTVTPRIEEALAKKDRAAVGNLVGTHARAVRMARALGAANAAIPKIQGMSPKEENADSEEIRRYMQTEKINPNFPNIPLKDALEYFMQTKRLNIVVDLRNVAGFDDLKVNFRADGMRLDRALALILRQHDLVYVIQDDYILVTARESVRYPKVLKIYDVSDLSGKIMNWVGPKIDISKIGDAVPNPFEEGNETTATQVNVEDLADVIKDVIKPADGDWGDTNKIVVH